MNCLFCSNKSDYSKSVEHIIPESLGNKEHILPIGLVCDACNQYFSIKIEKPLLEQPYFKNVRNRAAVENKKGKVPKEKAVVVSSDYANAEIFFDHKLGMTILEIENIQKLNKIISQSNGKIYVPALFNPEVNNKILSRFLAKVAVEGLLFKLIGVEGWIEEVMTMPELDNIKRYARFADKIDFWPYYQRRIYSETSTFNNQLISQENYNILHEFAILKTKEDHYYFVIAIFGIEYAINFGGPSIESYINWLKENNNISILEDPNEIKQNER